MIGDVVHLHTILKMPVDEILWIIATAQFLVQITRGVFVLEETIALMRMAYMNRGCILPAIEHSCAKMAKIAAVLFASLLIVWMNYVLQPTTGYQRVRY